MQIVGTKEARWDCRKKPRRIGKSVDCDFKGNAPATLQNTRKTRQGGTARDWLIVKHASIFQADTQEMRKSRWTMRENNQTIIEWYFVIIKEQFSEKVPICTWVTWLGYNNDELGAQMWPMTLQKYSVHVITWRISILQNLQNELIETNLSFDVREGETKDNYVQNGNKTRSWSQQSTKMR